MKKFITWFLFWLVFVLLGALAVVQYPKQKQWEQDRLERYICALNNDCD